MTRRPLARATPAGHPVAPVWQLRLHRGAGPRDPWQADAVGPGGALHFASLDDLSAWLRRLEGALPPAPASGSGIR